ncbi:MAG: hypothetical protein ACOCY1_06160 [Halovenus sp.]
MGYKGHPGLTDGDVGNVPPSPSSVTVVCAEPTCDETTTADKLPGDWQATNDPDEVILCPSCKQRVSGKERTPTEMRKENNFDVTEWAASDKTSADIEHPGGDRA